MATVATWKNSQFVVPLCGDLTFHPAGAHDFGCVCLGIPESEPIICTDVEFAPCYQFTVSGITNSFCADCEANANGTFILRSDALGVCDSHAFDCFFCSQERVICPADDSFHLWYLRGTGLGLTGLELIFNTGGQGAQWVGGLPNGPTDNITLSLNSSGVDCTNYPTTIVLTPVECA